MLSFQTTIFISALLLFSVQPMIAKAILPQYGGTSAVWTTCMMFFQTLLVAGYAYSHLLRSKLSPGCAYWIHAVVLVAACLTLPITPSISIGTDLTRAIIWTLAVSVGLPYFALATTGSLVQAWHHAKTDSTTLDERRSNENTYRLYGLSNLGSLLALLSYPFLVEPWLCVTRQTWIWSIAFAVFCALCLWTGFSTTKLKQWPNPHPLPSNRVAPSTSAGTISLWFLLSFCPSVTLLATTNLMCQEIASVPFLWILPLSLYLLSFMICFDRPSIYHRGFFGPSLLLSIIASIFIVQAHIYVSIVLQVTGLAVVCFLVAMTCHGELERLKPRADQLTSFFLIIALGGATGGICVAVLAPRVFDSFIEFQLAILLSLFLTIVCQWKSSSSSAGIWRMPHAASALLVGAIVLASLMFQLSPEFRPNEIFRARNEYGVVRVVQSDGYRKFISGQVDHGGQFVDADKRSIPSGYYGATSGFGIAMRRMRELKQYPSDGQNVHTPPTINAAVVGMGVGAMLAWSQPQDEFTMFELNPLVHQIAQEYFTFLRDHPSNVYIGDGRRRLAELNRKNGSAHYDIIAMDAFSSDAIPQHLLTDECFELYLRNLSQDGVIVAHITNRFVDLRPVVIDMAKRHGLSAWLREDQDSTGGHGTVWILISRNPNFSDVAWMDALQTPIPQDLPRIQWTDSFAPLSPVTRWSAAVDIADLKRSQKAFKTPAAAPHQ